MKKSNQEKIIKPEVINELVTSVEIDLFRHGKKNKNPLQEGGEKLKDDRVRLSEVGRAMADEAGINQNLKPQVEVAVSGGSSKDRSRESAVRRMLANTEKITPDMSLEEIEGVIKEEIVKIKGDKMGKKIIDFGDKLSFNESGTPEMEKLFAEADEKGEYNKFIVERSDEEAIKAGDKISSTYSRHSGNVAEVLLRYCEIGDNFNRIASKPDDNGKLKYEQFGNKLERYFGTHGGVTDSFLAKAIEIKKGIKERDVFISSVGNYFKEMQGIHVSIKNTGSAQEIIITYEVDGKNESVNLNREDLEKIVEDRKNFENKVKAGLSKEN